MSVQDVKAKLIKLRIEKIRQIRENNNEGLPLLSESLEEDLPLLSQRIAETPEELKAIQKRAKETLEEAEKLIESETGKKS